MNYNERDIEINQLEQNQNIITPKLKNNEQLKNTHGEKNLKFEPIGIYKMITHSPPETECSHKVISFITKGNKRLCNVYD